MERSKPPHTSAQAGPQRTTPPPQEPAARMVILVLIQEELKSRKLFNELHWLDYHNGFYKTDLLDIIMLAIGLNPRLCLQRSLCHTLLDQHSQRVVENAAELQDEATQVYDAFLKHARQLGYIKAGAPNSKSPFQNSATGVKSSATPATGP
jgi:hypothetical protein